MSPTIDHDDEEAKMAIFKAISDATDAWHKAQGRPSMHADVYIGPLLQHISHAIEASTECEHCRAELRVRYVNFLLEPMGVNISAEAAATPKEHLH